MSWVLSSDVGGAVPGAVSMPVRAVYVPRHISGRGEFPSVPGSWLTPRVLVRPGIDGTVCVEVIRRSGRHRAPFTFSSFYHAVSCISILGRHYLLFALKERLSIRVLLRGRYPRQGAMVDSPATVLRVGDCDCFQFVRQDGTRRREVIVPAILDHSNLSARLCPQGINLATNSNRGNATRSFRRHFVVYSIRANVALLRVRQVGELPLGVLRRVEHGRVPAINGHDHRINGLRKYNVSFSLSSKSASSHRAVPKATVNLIVGQDVKCRTTFLTQRIGTRLVSRPRYRRVVFPNDRNFLRIFMLKAIPRRVVGPPTRVHVTEDPSDQGRLHKEQVNVTTCPRPAVGRAVRAEVDHVKHSSSFLRRDRYLHNLRYKAKQVLSRGNAIRRQFREIVTRFRVVLSAPAPRRSAKIMDEEKGRARSFTYEQLSNRSATRLPFRRALTGYLRPRVRTRHRVFSKRHVGVRLPIRMASLGASSNVPRGCLRTFLSTRLPLVDALRALFPSGISVLVVVVHFRFNQERLSSVTRRRHPTE